ncbi:MAG TPA: LrgB family protein [Oceanithermus profundus]|uniref:LrgB family protein n=1 Tax=Oceanithermus profundus TaxID=187137 RepID=A0A7C4V6B5_9DEIN|nr:LrgB family protein [Oceanithermus profundus]
MALVATVVVFLLAERLYRRFPHPLANPVGLAVAALVLALKFGGFSLERYQLETRPLVWMLKPAVVALGWVAWRERGRLGGRWLPFLGGLLAGTTTSLLLTPLLARALGAGPELQKALALKSITSAVAVDLAPRLGVSAELAVPLIILAGILGAALGPAALDRIGARDPVVRGTALGTASHGIGTARAAEEGPLALATSGLAMAAAGLLTALLAPLVFWLLGL